MRKNLPVTGSEYLLQDGAQIVSRTDLNGIITFCNPDFVALAKSFGVPAQRVEGGGPALEAALKRAIAEGGPHLIEVPVGVMPSPWTLLRLKGKNPSAPPTPSVR